MADDIGRIEIGPLDPRNTTMREVLKIVAPHVCAEPDRALFDLLAVIHRDGGQHTGEVGVEQSVRDAHQVWARLVADREAIVREWAKGRKTAGLRCSVCDADPLSADSEYDDGTPFQEGDPCGRRIERDRCNECGTARIWTRCGGTLQRLIVAPEVKGG